MTLAVDGLSARRSILLVGSDDRGALAATRALGARGHRVSIVRFTPRTTAAGQSRYCSESMFLGEPAAGVRAFLDRLHDLVRAGRYDALLPVDDVALELVASDYAAISSHCRVMGPSPASYARVRDHRDASALARESGLLLPETQRVDRNDDGRITPHFPCVVRPVVACDIVDDEPRLFSVRLVRTADELDAKLRDDLPRGDVLIEYPGAGEGLGLGVCALDGEVLGACLAVRLHERRRGGESSYSRLEVMPPGLLAIARDMARKTAWTGFMTIACRREGDRVTFTGLKAHPTSDVALALRGGLNLPALLADALEGKQATAAAEPQRAIHLRDVRRDLAWIAETGRTSGRKAILPWLASFARVATGSERFELEQVSDLRPAAHELASAARALGGRLARRLPWRTGQGATQRVVHPRVTKSSALLVVCQGNINRSVVAEHLLKARGFTRVRSAGLLAMSGRRASAHAERFIGDRIGGDISTHRSASVAHGLREMGEPDLVVCFEERHALELAERFPALAGRICRLGEFADRAARDIADPHGKRPEDYLSCFREIDEIIDQVAAGADATK
ncbi:MAG: hypothetical protein AB7J30_14365 [Hyphomicrobium sp.]|uniref:arsenate reductase/protein-tyrosine-phosphatase family protein n=1 Tax=Hyphomicrobium sp. TaxID=82 RepID=UPI003D105C92